MTITSFCLFTELTCYDTIPISSCLILLERLAYSTLPFVTHIQPACEHVRGINIWMLIAINTARSKV